MKTWWPLLPGYLQTIDHAQLPWVGICPLDTNRGPRTDLLHCHRHVPSPFRNGNLQDSFFVYPAKTSKNTIRTTKKNQNGKKIQIFKKKVFQNGPTAASPPPIIAHPQEHLERRNQPLPQTCPQISGFFAAQYFS